MLNIILPMAGMNSLQSEMENHYPSALAEINERPLIQYVIENLAEIDLTAKFTVILRDEDCKKFHLDNTIRLLTGNNVNIVKVRQETAGALCSILLAVDYFNDDSPVIISNADQIIDRKALINFMGAVATDMPSAACPVFNSVHPRWSYVRIENGEIIEAAEKNPISNNAVAGLYFFESGKEFIKLATAAILNGRQANGNYFTSSVLNEYILAGLRVLPVALDIYDYHSLYTAKRLLDYSEMVRSN